MKTTKKSINETLPRLDELRRNFLLPGSAGRIPYPHMRHLKCAMMDIDPVTSQASRCVVYGVGDALEYDHYHGNNCVDVTDQIIEWMRDYEVTRKECINAIYDMINKEE